MKKRSVDSIFGSIDCIDESGISGWAIDANSPKNPLGLVLYFGKNKLMTFETKIFLEEVQEITGEPNVAGFHIGWEQINNIESRLAQCPQGRKAPIKVLSKDGDFALEIDDNLAPYPEEIQSWISRKKNYGNLDEITEDVMVTGWAYSEDTTLKEVMINISGIPYKKVYPALPRIDFVDKQQHPIFCGFEVQIAEEELSQPVFEVSAFYDGKELNGSPLLLDLSKNIKLSILNIRSHILAVTMMGWHGLPLKAILTIDLLTKISFEFVKKSEGGGDWHTYIKLPEKYYDGQHHVYQIEIEGIDANVKSEFSIQKSPDFRSHIEFSSSRLISGWCYKPDMNESLKIKVELGKKCIFSTASLSCTDQVIDEDGKNWKNIGFIVALPSHSDLSHVTIKDVASDLVICKLPIPQENINCSIEKKLKLNYKEQKLNPKKNPVFISKPYLKSKSTDKKVIDVVLPIFEGAKETIQCLNSIFTAKNNTSINLLIINDFSPNQIINDYLKTITSIKNIQIKVIYRTNNGGFSSSVNIGLALSKNDVIILNSDTVVSNGWVDKLMKVADSQQDIGTVTPFSNNAEICSIPYICQSQNVRIDLSQLERINTIAERKNSLVAVELPTGVGFCMYIKRACLNEVGLLDTNKWPRGYGEEVDFCQKAIYLGWKNVLATNTFVFHYGGISFGDEKKSLIESSSKKISQLYPYFNNSVNLFIKNDPAKTSREHINLGIINFVTRKKRILHIAHKYGGGTSRYVDDQCEINFSNDYFPVVLEFDSNMQSSLIFKYLDSESSKLFNKKYTQEFKVNEISYLKKTIAQFNFDSVHLHSPFGMPDNFLNWVVEKYKFDITVHDYAWICPRVTLTNGNENTYCGEPPPAGCNKCLSQNPLHPGLKHALVNTGDISKYREKFAKIFLQALNVNTGSHDVKKRLEKYRFKANYVVKSYSFPKLSPFNKKNIINQLPDSNNNIVVAILGAISDVKGFYQYIDCIKISLMESRPIKFIFFGTTLNNSLISKFPNVEVTGSYKDEDLDDIIQKFRPHLALFLNQWPETYSYTLTHCFRLGIWPIVTDLGAPPERVQNNNFGTIIKHTLTPKLVIDSIISTAYDRKINVK